MDIDKLIYDSIIKDGFFDALQKTETGGQSNPNKAVGDKGESIGSLQIQENYFNDAMVQYNKDTDLQKAFPELKRITYDNVKNRDTAGRIWLNYVKAAVSDAETDYLSLNGTGALVDNVDVWNDTAPTSTVFTVGLNASANQSGNDMIAYCFHGVEGYSKFGAYVGNGSADGTFVYTGFRPAWVMIKKSSGTDGWSIYDSAMETINVMDTRLSANLADAEVSGSNIALDFLSNGFKLKGTGTTINTGGQTYIYLAFAEAPFKYANAR